MQKSAAVCLAGYLAALMVLPAVGESAAPLAQEHATAEQITSNPGGRIRAPSDYQSAVAFEAAGGTKAEVVAKLKDSFAHLKAALAWLGTITHIHEHLGQSIAYARSNHVVPPWSR
jgi:hypothetical protein